LNSDRNPFRPCALSYFDFLLQVIGLRFLNSNLLSVRKLGSLFLIAVDLFLSHIRLFSQVLNFRRGRGSFRRIPIGHSYSVSWSFPLFKCCEWCPIVTYPIDTNFLLFIVDSTHLKSFSDFCLGVC